MCCFPAREPGCCREVGTVSQRREGLRSSLHFLFPPFSLLSGSGCVENKRQTVRTNRTRFHGGENRSIYVFPHCQVGFKTLPPGCVALGAMADPLLRPCKACSDRPDRLGTPGPRSCHDCSRLPGLQWLQTMICW